MRIRITEEQYGPDHAIMIVRSEMWRYLQIFSPPCMQEPLRKQRSARRIASGNSIERKSGNVIAILYNSCYQQNHRGINRARGLSLWTMWRWRRFGGAVKITTRVRRWWCQCGGGQFIVRNYDGIRKRTVSGLSVRTYSFFLTKNQAGS